MQPLFVAPDADGSVEEFAEPGRGEQLLAGAVGNDAAAVHEDNALDFRKNVAKMMGHEDEAGAFSGKASKRIAQFALGREVEGVGWLVKQKLAWTMDQGSSDQDTALFSRRHFADKPSSKMRGFDSFKGFDGPFTHLRRDVEIGPERRSRKESGNHRVETRRDGGAFTGQVSPQQAGTDHAEVATKLGQVPPSRPKMRTLMPGWTIG